MRIGKGHRILGEADNVELTSMIDVVFLLLIYFMVTAAIIKSEADLGVTLPTPAVRQDQPLDLPEEHLIDILEDGQVVLNGQPFDGPLDPNLPRLTATLIRLRESSDLAGVKTLVTIQADPWSRHGRVVDVLNACATAQITLVSFGLGS